MRVNSIVYLEIGIVEQQKGRGRDLEGRGEGDRDRERDREREGGGWGMMAAVLLCVAAQERHYLVSTGSWFRFVSCRA